MIDRGRHSSALDVRSFRAADCDTDPCLVVAKLRDRLSVSKRAAQKFYMQRFDLKKLDDAEVKEQYQGRITNWSAALKNLDDNVDIS
jgi:hypothetical protein